MSTNESSCISQSSIDKDLKKTGQELIRYDLVTDYGKEIECYLRRIERETQLKANHLEAHEVRAAYRAKMVDWMCEVLGVAYKSTCTDQTFFLAVSLLDRYIQALEARNEVFKSSDLHLTGVTCMFIASKYEDMIPLYLNTVFAKIGHSKLSTESILAKEQDILRALGFRIGAPTALEYIGCLFESVPSLRDHPEKCLLQNISIYLSKMALHHLELYTKPTSLIA